MDTIANTTTNQEAVLYILTNDTILMRVLEESPRAAELLTEYGLHCLGCYFSELDTVETGARIHGMTDDEITDMITEINEQMEKEWKEQK
jgi:hybrid cluster-associated redox disulfide protein